MKRLVDNLGKEGLEAINLKDKVMVLPFGGRILGVYPDGIHNVLWVNQALNSAGAAGRFFRGEDWINIGGDRTWISPEVETTIGDPDRFEDSYEVPKSIDPASYRVMGRDDNSVVLKTRMSVPFKRSGSVVGLRITKRISCLGAPLAVPKGVQWAGYSLATSLIVESALSARFRPGIWNILQVPGGGNIIVPLTGATHPRPFIGEPVVTVKEKMIEARVETSQSFKYGIHAGRCTGLMLYVNEKDDPAYLTVRRFNVFAPERYADVPCDDLRATGYMQQVYVDDGAFGGFGEMEYHSPAAAVENRKIDDISEVWAFMGPQKSIANLVDHVLALRSNSDP